MNEPIIQKGKPHHVFDTEVSPNQPLHQHAVMRGMTRQFIIRQQVRALHREGRQVDHFAAHGRLLEGAEEFGKGETVVSVRPIGLPCAAGCERREDDPAFQGLPSPPWAQPCSRTRSIHCLSSAGAPYM